MSAPRFGIAQLELKPEEKSALMAFVRSWKDHAKPVLFAGAGLSRNAKRRPQAPTTSKFASWSELMDVLRKELSNGDETIEALLPSDPLRLAQVYEFQSRRGLLLDRIAEHVPSADFVPGEVHRKLARLPWAAIVTTNYDDLIERTFSDSRVVRTVVQDLDLTQRRTPDDLLVLKMHGDLADRASIIITEEDYRLYDTTHRGLVVKVRQLLLEHPLMFVGFSLTDPNFKAIDGWIRDTVGNVRLPAVAIMQGPAIPADAYMWKARGIEIIRLPDANPRHLERLFDALKTERLAGSGAKRRRPHNDRIESIYKRIYEILQRRKETQEWETAVAGQLAEAISGAASDPDGGDGARRLIIGFCHGVLGHDGFVDTVSIYEILLKTTGRQFLWFALESQQIDFAAGRGRRIDLSEELLKANDLSPDERARIHLIRASVNRAQGAFKVAMDNLEEARKLVQSSELRADIGEELDDVLFLIGNPDQIEAEMKSPVDYNNVYALCRRGSQALLLKEADSATRWYKLALERAVTGDEQFVALWGLRVSRASSPFDDIAEDEEFREALNEIPETDRPLSKEVFQLLDDAGQSLLEGKANAAIIALKDYLRRSRLLGWPHSRSYSMNFPMEIAAAQAARLLLARNEEGKAPPLADIREGVTLAVQFGLARQMDDLFERHILDALASDVESVQWFRTLSSAEGGVPRARDTRHVLAIAGLPMLDDEKISHHVSHLQKETLAFISDRMQNRGRLPDTLSDRWKHVAHYGEHLPEAAVGHVIDAIEASIPDGYVFSTMEGGKFDWALWRKLGTVTPDSLAIRRVVRSLAETVGAENRVDPFWTREATALAMALQRADLLTGESATHALSFATALLEQTTTQAESIHTFLLAADLVQSLDPKADILDRVLERLIGSYETIATSSLLPDWALVVGRMAGRLSGVHAEKAALLAGAYASQCLTAKNGSGRLFASPLNAAFFLAAMERKGKKAALSEAATSTILKLGERDGRALRNLFDEGVLPGDDVMSAGERILVQSLERGTDEPSRLRALSSAEAWLCDVPVEREGGRRLLDLAVLGLSSESPRVRERSWLVVGRVTREHPSLYVEQRRRAYEIALSDAVVDLNWEVRGTAALALGSIARLPEQKKAALEQLASLVADRIALVRRTAEVAVRMLKGS